ncbi:FMN-binding negative transcriptional regulator [Chitinophaga vietnamensis]|uniref:FMN-binding negative transcriptional regulator n=1 Tax=Chitinophaga vietnamensis TaxID=2593957 RepID=UPI001177BAA5|nr:FMN-binding negative transcriptional regulator [Chitinophaga vietnamensis]
MHTPNYNKETNWETIAAFIRENSFGMLVNTDEEGTPHATHIPMMLVEKSPGNFVLHGHIAKINPQWQWFTKADTLAVFSEPHTYVSASWYEKDRISTWNYIAVHVHGRIRIMSEEELRQALGALVDTFEAGSEHPVHISDIDEKTMQNNLKAIVGFELPLTQVNARYKLSQNKNEHDYNSVIDHLKARGDVHSLRIAAEMEARRGIKKS